MSRQVDLAGAAHLVLAPGLVHLDPQAAVFKGMLDGWARQQRSRLLGDATVAHRLRVVRRFGEFTNDYPWTWQPADVEEFSGSLRGRGAGVLHNPDVSAGAGVVLRVCDRSPLWVGSRM